MYWLQILGGLSLLTLGGELLVRGSTKLAASFRIPNLTIGLTVVAFGTSSPELFVSIDAALSQNGDIAIANAVGSNIFNVLLILGVSALILPLGVSQQIIRRDVPIMILISLILWLMAMIGFFYRFEGFLLLASLFTYTYFKYREASKSLSEPESNEVQPTKINTSHAHRSFMAGLIFGSLALLAFGSDLFVEGASALARKLGVSDLVIGLTLVSAGTSLPEVATSVIAAIRKERDIAVGNVIGSNVFNILGVLGAATIASPKPLAVAPNLLKFDMPMMLVSAALCFPIFLTGRTISRKEGFFFLILYVAYVGFLIWHSGSRVGL